MPPTLTKRQAVIDVMVVACCSIAYVVASLLRIAIGPVIAIVVAVLIVYAITVLARRPQAWRDYGVRTDNLAAATIRVGSWTLLSAMLIVIWSVASGYSIFRPELLILLPFYPLWGLVQQFIFQGILHRALLVLMPNQSLALLVNSVAFASVHASDWRVVLLTFVAGICWSWFYQRWPNIWVLGVSHGILAGLTYPLLLGDNPLERFL